MIRENSEPEEINEKAVVGNNQALNAAKTLQKFLDLRGIIFTEYQSIE